MTIILHLYRLKFFDAFQSTRPKYLNNKKYNLKFKIQNGIIP